MFQIHPRFDEALLLGLESNYSTTEMVSGCNAGELYQMNTLTQELKSNLMWVVG